MHRFIDVWMDGFMKGRINDGCNTRQNRELIIKGEGKRHPLTVSEQNVNTREGSKMRNLPNAIYPWFVDLPLT